MSSIKEFSKTDCKRMQRAQINNLFRTVAGEAKAKDIIKTVNDGSLDVQIASPNQYRDLLVEGFKTQAAPQPS